MPLPPRPPAVPDILDPDLLMAVSALTRAAGIVRQAMIHVAQMSPEGMDFMVEHQETLLQADAVIDEFVEYMSVNGPKE